MRAVVINQPGDTSVLQIVDRPMPTPDANASVMKIHAFGVHRYEVLTRAGGSPSVHFPRVIGVEAVGEIQATTPDSPFTVGQKVVTFNGGFGREFDGSYQEYAKVPNQILYPVKFDGDWTTLAEYPETFYTAFGALKATKLQAGQHLLVRGGTTGVGMAATKLAKGLGLTVTATTRQASRQALIAEVGADHSILDTDGKLATTESYDGIIDLVGMPAISDTLQHLNAGGICTEVGLLTGEWRNPDFDPFSELPGKYLTTYDSTKVDAQMVTELFELIQKHDLQIPISKVFKLADIRDAHDYVMRSDRPVGQVIVTND